MGRTLTNGNGLRKSVSFFYEPLHPNPHNLSGHEKTRRRSVAFSATSVHFFGIACSQYWVRGRWKTPRKNEKCTCSPPLRRADAKHRACLSAAVGAASTAIPDQNLTSRPTLSTFFFAPAVVLPLCNLTRDGLRFSLHRSSETSGLVVSRWSRSCCSWSGIFTL